MKLDEVAKWKPFVSVSGEVFDLSFLNSHEVTYYHESSGKKTIQYKFTLTYSLHCFAKEYSEQTVSEKQELMYTGPKESRPFCIKRYSLAKQHLRDIIDRLGSGTVKVSHGGYGSFAATKILTPEGVESWYFVSFKAYKHQKRFRLHIMSAYPVEERPRDKKVGFFKIAHGVKVGKLPKPQM